MNILSPTLAAGAYAPARRTTASEPSPTPKAAMIAAALAAARKPDQALVRAKSAQAMASPLFAGADAVKTQARAKLQQVRERLNILKKLYAANPKEMARALAQVFKELKAAVKAFKDAGGQELSMSEAAVSAAFAPPADKTGPDKGATDTNADAKPAESAPTSEGAEAAAPDAETDPAEEPATGDSEEAETASQAPRAAGYDAAGAPADGPGGGAFREVLGQVRKAIGEDGLEFAKEVRALSNALSDVLEGARVQILARRPDKKTDEAFKDADEGLKSLREDLEKMTREIRQAVPAAGMKLSMTA